ncbi:helix-turn-helix domain-containing protein [Microaerobacter geothermalis]|uniref:helix-turn-helix domain-containing protein n=1 Tax=Microaerobacter geothermalis TaxID=674972 RepID=UPI001F38584E|nr:helix-turn-helix transcriptional regulator [Microaerobacter geothermalis]MCF6094333.1 helix-turn-helix domain-containing protein [Microaerobacter geothermalis]
MNSLPKQARIATGLSIEEAARKLGIPAGYLSQIENGQRQVSAERAEKIANLYNKKKDEIFLPSRYAIREVNAGNSEQTATSA